MGRSLESVSGPVDIGGLAQSMPAEVGGFALRAHGVSRVD